MNHGDEAMPKISAARTRAARALSRPGARRRHNQLVMRVNAAMLKASTSHGAPAGNRKSAARQRPRAQREGEMTRKELQAEGGGEGEGERAQQAARASWELRGGGREKNNWWRKEEGDERKGGGTTQSTE
eukprot:12002172-Alexandrium_andersonii.AAC.1